MRTLVAWLACAAAVLAEDREPEVIDHKRTKQYAKIPASAGDKARIVELAAPLKDLDAEQTFRNIHAFIASRVPRVPEQERRL